MTNESGDDLKAAIEELEDAIDCAGAAREDHEIVTANAGSIRIALDTIERLQADLERAFDLAFTAAKACGDRYIEDGPQPHDRYILIEVETNEALQAIDPERWERLNRADIASRSDKPHDQ